MAKPKQKIELQVTKFKRNGKVDFDWPFYAEAASYADALRQLRQFRNDNADTTPWLVTGEGLRNSKRQLLLN